MQTRSHQQQRGRFPQRNDRRNEKCNSVEISDPFRNFTSDEWHQLQQQGQNLVQQYRIDIQNNGR